MIFVGDASMSPYEIMEPGGSVEHHNPEPGTTWVRRLSAHWPRLIWLNPAPQAWWDYTESIGLMRSLVGDRMYPLTLAGLDAGLRELRG